MGQVVFARNCPGNGDAELLVIFVNPVGHLVLRKKPEKEARRELRVAKKFQ